MERAAHVAQAVAREQVRLVYRQGLTGSWGNIIAAMATSGLLAVAELPWWSQLPMVGVGLAYTWRLVLLRWFKRAENTESHAVWRRRAVVNSLAGGVAWGLMGVLVFPYAPDALKLYLLVLAAGLTSAALATLAPVHAGFLAYLLPFFGSMATATAFAFPRFPLPMAGLLFFYVSVMWRTSLEQAHTIEHSLRLSEEKRALVEELVDAQRRAEEARARAEAANRAKSDFLARMSHEIRTPMNGILGVSELLLLGELPSEERGLAETAHRSGQALLAIIDDVLDMSKIEAGKVTLERAAFTVEPLAEEVVALFSVAAGRKGVHLAYELDDAVPAHVEGDPVRLRQVLTNLVGNAVKFTHHGEVLLAIRPGTAPGRVRFEVRDTGIGLDAEQRARVFAAFEQGDTSTTRRYGGTGLGLSIAQQLVLLMGGQLDVTSAPRSGSTFFFELPLPPAPVTVPTPPVVEGRGRPARLLVSDARAEATLARWLTAAGFTLAGPDDTPTVLVTDEAGWAQVRHASIPVVVIERALSLTHHPGETGVQRLGGPLRRSAVLEALARALGTPTASAFLRQDARWRDARVLVVDDDAVNRSVLQAMLTKLGCAPEIAPNGRAALEVLTHRPFDLVFMDLEMPELDGEGVTRQLRELEHQEGRPRLPIVALTAHATPGHRDRCLAAGMDEMMTKPISVASLSRCLARTLTVHASG